MSVSGQAGHFAFALQNAKSDEGGYVAPTSFERHKAMDINFGPTQDLRTLALEIGGVPVPTGAYKAGAFVAGGATIQPRAQGSLGILLKMGFGAATTTPGTASPTAVHANFDASATGPVAGPYTNPPSTRRILLTPVTVVGTAVLTVTGTDDLGAALVEAGISVSASPVQTAGRFKTVTAINVTTGATSGQIGAGFYQTNSHKFAFATDPLSIPWGAVRKIIPGSTAANRLGEAGIDCKLTSLRVAFPQNGVITARPDFLGRIPAWQDGADLDTGGTGWLSQFANAYEDHLSIPVTCDVDGSISLPNYPGGAYEPKVTQLAVIFGNNVTSPQQEMIIGSPYPDDFTPLTRGMSLQAVIKWRDPALYRRLLLSGNTPAQGWSATPFETDFQALVTAASMVPGSAATKYSLRVDCARVVWNVQGPITPVAGELLMMPLIGTVIEPTSGDYNSITLVNERGGY